MASFPIPSGFPAGGPRRPQRQQMPQGQRPPQTRLGQTVHGAIGALQEGVGAGKALMEMVEMYRNPDKRASAEDITKKIMFGEATDEDIRRLAEVMPITEALQWKQTREQLMEKKEAKEKQKSLERTKEANTKLMQFLIRISSAEQGQLPPPYKPGQTQQRVLFENAFPKFREELAKTPEGQDKVGFILPMLRSAMADGVIDDNEQMNILTALQMATGRIDDGIKSMIQQIAAESQAQAGRAAEDRKAARGQTERFEDASYEADKGGYPRPTAIPRPGAAGPGAPAAAQGPASSVAEYAKRAKELVRQRQTGPGRTR